VATGTFRRRIELRGALPSGGSASGTQRSRVLVGGRNLQAAGEVARVLPKPLPLVSISPPGLGDGRCRRCCGHAGSRSRTQGLSYAQDLGITANINAAVTERSPSWRCSRIVRPQHRRARQSLDGWVRRPRFWH